MQFRSKSKTKGDRLREGFKDQTEDNFYERVMVQMEEAGQTQIADFLKELREKEEAKAQSIAEKEAREANPASTASPSKIKDDANQKVTEKWKSGSPQSKPMPPSTYKMRKSPILPSD